MRVQVPPSASAPVHDWGFFVSYSDQRMPARVQAPVVEVGRLMPSTSRSTRVVGDVTVEIIRSARRKKTVSAKLLNWYTIEVRVPAHLSPKELDRIVADVVDKALARRAKMRSFRSDAQLQKRAQYLNRKFFDGQLRWRSIRFVRNQNTCFGSCSPTRGTIRISHRLRQVPAFVLDYVLAHELAHLVEANHSAAFWELVYRYPKAERARGYLMALQMEHDVLVDDEEDQPA